MVAGVSETDVRRQGIAFLMATGSGLRISDFGLRIAE